MIWNRKSLLLAAAGLGVLCAGAGSASAMQLPNSYHYEQRLDRGQHGVTDVVVGRNGVATVTTRFTNAKPGDRDRFVADIVFRDRSGRPVASLAQERVLEGAYRGRASQARVVDHVRLVRPQWAQVYSIDVRMRTADRGDWNRGGDPGRRWQDPPRRYDLPGERPRWIDPDQR